jgi:hypothetical protein
MPIDLSPGQERSFPDTIAECREHNVWDLGALLRHRLLVLLLLTSLGCPALAQDADERVRAAADKALKSKAPSDFTPGYKRALGTFLSAEALYLAGRYTEAKRLLDALWTQLPPGTEAWGAVSTRNTSVNFGDPCAYYALRMLSVCVAWKLGPRPPGAARTLRWTAVLADQSAGLQPRNRRELSKGEGVKVRNALDHRLRRGAEAILEVSTRLFREYVEALTGGRLKLVLKIHRLSGVSLPVHAKETPLRMAGLAPQAMDRVWANVPDSVLRTTDWWSVIYPSHVPEQRRDFRTTEFITGGMGVGPGGGPCFIADDRWFVRKPPHLGAGDYTPAERRAYLPQWFQHEFFHHLYRSYPTLGLEAKSHQWFDRKTWPQDFAGRFEADYYHESWAKRLRSASPPLHARLRYASPPARVLRRIAPRTVEGTYRREPYENGYHEGRLKREGSGFRWSNKADRSWAVSPDWVRGRLIAGPGTPYYSADDPAKNDMRLVLERDPRTGDHLPRLEGILFLGEVYRRVSD